MSLVNNYNYVCMTFAFKCFPQNICENVLNFKTIRSFKISQMFFADKFLQFCLKYFAYVILLKANRIW